MGALQAGLHGAVGQLEAQAGGHVVAEHRIVGRLRVAGPAVVAQKPRFGYAAGQKGIQQRTLDAQAAVARAQEAQGRVAAEVGVVHAHVLVGQALHFGVGGAAAHRADFDKIVAVVEAPPVGARGPKPGVGGREGGQVEAARGFGPAPGREAFLGLGGAGSTGQQGG